MPEKPPQERSPQEEPYVFPRPTRISRLRPKGEKRVNVTMWLLKSERDQLAQDVVSEQKEAGEIVGLGIDLEAEFFHTQLSGGNVLIVSPDGSTRRLRFPPSRGTIIEFPEIRPR